MVFFVVVGFSVAGYDGFDEESVRVFSSRERAEAYGEYLVECGTHDSYVLGERVLDSFEAEELVWG